MYWNSRFITHERSNTNYNAYKVYGDNTKRPVRFFIHGFHLRIFHKENRRVRTCWAPCVYHIHYKNKFEQFQAYEQNQFDVRWRIRHFRYTRARIANNQQNICLTSAKNYYCCVLGEKSKLPIVARHMQKPTRRSIKQS